MPAWQASKFCKTKSFNVAVIDCEERVSTRKLAKHSPARPKAVRFRPPSKNSTCPYFPVGVPCLSAKFGSSEIARLFGSSLQLPLLSRVGQFVDAQMVSGPLQACVVPAAAAAICVKVKLPSAGL